MNYSSSIQSLWTEAKNYLELQKEYLKLDTAEKLAVLLSAVATTAICLILGLVAFFFFVMAFAFWLAKIVLLARKRWIVQPVARFVAGLFISEETEAEDEP